MDKKRSKLKKLLKLYKMLTSDLFYPIWCTLKKDFLPKIMHYWPGEYLGLKSSKLGKNKLYMIFLYNLLNPKIMGEITRIWRNRFFGSERQRNQLKNIIKLLRELNTLRTYKMLAFQHSVAPLFIKIVRISYIGVIVA